MKKLARKPWERLRLAQSFLLISALAMTSVCASTQTTDQRETSVHYAGSSDISIKRVAIMDFKHTLQKWYPQNEIAAFAQSSERDINNGGEIMTDMFVSELMSIGLYQVIERSSLVRIMDELKLSSSGLTKDEMDQLGQLLQIDGLILGKVNRFSEKRTAMISQKIRVSLTVRLVDIKSGVVVWVATDELESSGTPTEVAQALCSKIVNGIASAQ